MADGLPHDIPLFSEFTEHIERLLTQKKRRFARATKEQGRKRARLSGVDAKSLKTRRVSKARMNVDDSPIVDPTAVIDESRNEAPGMGDDDPDIVFVSFTLQQSEEQLGSAFTTQAGARFRRMVDEVEVAERIYYTSVLRSATALGKKPTKKEVDNDLCLLMRDLREMKPRLVVLCGVDAFHAIFLHGNYDKRRGTLQRRDGIDFAVTFHYASLSSNPNDVIVCRKDLIRFRHILDGTYAPSEKSYFLIRSLEQAKELCDVLRSTPFAFDVETDGLNMFVENPRLNTIAFSMEADSAFCVPVDHPDSPFAENEKEQLFDMLREIFVSKAPKYGHNVKFDQKWVWTRLGVWVENVKCDTMLAHYILDERLGRHGLERLAIDYLSATPYKIDTSEPTSQVPLLDLYRYNCTDADYTFQLVGILTKYLEDDGLYPVFRDLIMLGLDVLTRMECFGTQIDAKALCDAHDTLEAKVNDAEQQLNDLAADIEGFTLHSEKQLHNLFFNVLEMPSVKQTPSGAPSLDESVLKAFAEDHDCLAAKLLLEFRHYSKLLSTYVVGMAGSIHADGKLHPLFNIHITRTGRLSCEDPNMQNLPKRDSDSATMIRGFIVSSFDDGWILQADYRQAEVGMLALCSKDKVLIDLYNSGKDIHIENAAWMSTVKPERVTKKQRLIAKGITFGIIYGQGTIGLAKTVGCSKDKAQEHIDQFFHRYFQVKQWISDIHEFAKKNGYVLTIYGRKCRIYGAKSNVSRIQAEAMRKAQNAPIQSPASDMTWHALAECDRLMREEGLQSRPILSVHDANVFDCAPDEVEIVAELVKLVMESVIVPDNDDPEFHVKFKVDVEVGKSFGALVPFEEWQKAHNRV